MRSVLLAALGLGMCVSPVVGQTPETTRTFQAFLFGDVVYSATDAEGGEGFQLGQLVAHGNAVLTDQVLFFGELSLTGRSTGYAVEVERMILRYDFSDAVKVSVGRYHTPISYWNTAFHHGLWLQGSVARPEPIRFGSNFIPVHFVGAQGEGQIPGAPLHYVVGVGNGRGGNIARAGDAGDVNASRAFLASASLRPASLFGFQVGGAVYLDRVRTEAGDDVDERIASGHVVWDRGRVDLIGEYIDIEHRLDLPDLRSNSDSWYLHVGVRLPGELERLTPYVRVERMEIGENDPVFDGVVRDYDAVVGGIRYDFSLLSALKIEYRREELAGAEEMDGLFVQASFAVPLLGG